MSAGWTVERPVYHLENGGYWVAYCRGTPLPEGQADAPYWEALGQTEADALRELARCIRELGEGRVPK